MSPICSIIVAIAIGTMVMIAEIASDLSCTPPNTVDDHSIGLPIQGAALIPEKSIANDSTPNPLPTITATRYAPIMPRRIGTILIMPLPKILNKITSPSATSASHQLLLQLLTADGARPRPIAIMIGPVTTGGNSFITLLTPTALIQAATTTYKRPAQATPRHAYGRSSLFPVPSALSGATAR